MFTSFSVRNFRCFSDLTVEPLGRINLIAGKNNAGKSSLLEAIHLHCIADKPHLWIKVHKLRGIEDPLDAIEEIAAWNFHHGDHTVPIESKSHDGQGVERSTSFQMVDAATSREQFPNEEAWIANTLRGSGEGRLILRYSINGKETVTVGPVEKSSLGGYQSIGGHIEEKIPNLFLGSLIADEDRDIGNFGILKRDKRDHELLPALQKIESRIQDLDLVPFAGKPRIHADIDGFDQLVPVSQIGEGMRRLLSILLAIANVPNGIVCIDEIENGLHYSVQPQIWAAIAEAARRANVQVFATTHSWDCLRAAHETFADDDVDDFRLHRLDRIQDRITATIYDRDSLETSLELGFEVR